MPPAAWLTIGVVTLGAALAAQGKLDEAAAHFADALRLKPDFAAAFETPLVATPKKLSEMLALTGGPGGGDWKWGSSALQIGATVVQPHS